MSSEYDWLRQAHGPAGDSNALFELARRLEEAGDLHVAATAYDRAFGLSPSNGEIASARQSLLERLAVNEHGLRFVYVPGGTFLMGSETGELDHLDTAFCNQVDKDQPEAALSTLEKIAEEIPCRGGFWRDLERAALAMEMKDRANYFRGRFLSTKPGS